MFEHDLSYLLEVLNIDASETEEQLDERLKFEAKELGVDVEDRLSLATHLSEYSRRSESIDSRASQSTGLTSHYSDLSRERRPSRPSLSFRDYDAFLATGKPNGRNSISFSPTATPSLSTFSLPLSYPASPESSPRRHFRRIRGLSMLRLHRPDTNDGCPHCPQDSVSRIRSAHKLLCGHRLCTQALRNTVQAATETTLGSVPSCCGKPIPGSVVEAVMTQEEQTALLEKLDQWDEAISLVPSKDGSRRTSAALALNGDHSRATSSSGTSVETPSPQALLEIERITALPEYITLLESQLSQRTRFLSWSSSQRTFLSEKHDKLRTVMRTTHEAAAEDLAEFHANALSEAEDKQVDAEAEMREIHAKDLLSADTALRHMETYCAGIYSNGEPHGRNITEQDFAQLDFARRERDVMPGRQESAINVLRGEQGRRIRLRGARQERERGDLVRGQRKEELEFERGCSKEVGVIESSLEVKKARIGWRWELEMAVLAKKVGEGEEVVRLPAASWEEGIGGNDGGKSESCATSPATTFVEFKTA